MGSELTLSFKEQIAAAHNRGERLYNQFRQVLIDGLNCTREVGTLLETAQADLNKYQWEELKENLPFDDKSVRAYMAFSRKHPEKIQDIETGMRSMKDALMAGGLLEFPKGHGEQISRDPPGFKAWSAEMIMQYAHRFKKYLSAKPLDTWTAPEAEQFLYGMKPLLSVHKRVQDWLRLQ